MLIAKNSVVTLAYRVADSDGNVVDEGSALMVYLHGGYDGIFPRIEESLQGKKVDDKLEIKLLPDDAFGEYDADLVNIESRNLFLRTLRSACSSSAPRKTKMMKTFSTRLLILPTTRWLSMATIR